MRPGLLRGDGHTIWVLLQKTKIPYDSTRWARKPLRPFQRTRRSPCFTHTQGRRFPSNCETCSGKPRKVFLCTKCLLLQACYPSFARRWNGTLDTVCCKYAYGTALWRTSFRKHCPSRSSALTAGTDWEGAVLQTEEIPRSLKCSHCGQIFSPSRQKRFRHRALSVEENKGTP